MIEDAIKEGDFEKAELLSDTLANREFAVKISKAFAAKRHLDNVQEQRAIEKERRLKKIRWTFDAKERWQMKGNM
ncbi:protein FAM204A-like [Stegodyphus dumicola]|uniref:protein FAM204A-like n=1 Tax=Stegodyphus dumicola TaxID=202533 RepID=UPI0015AF68B9|nr:protein FAM204A-like [Stegodyphus dumicola]